MLLLPGAHRCGRVDPSRADRGGRVGWRLRVDAVRFLALDTESGRRLGCSGAGVSDTDRSAVVLIVGGGRAALLSSWTAGCPVESTTDERGMASSGVRTHARALSR
jgi:hypothetical protein